VKNRRALPALVFACPVVFLGAVACGTDREAASVATDAGGGLEMPAPGGADGGPSGGMGGPPDGADAALPLPDLGSIESADPCPAACDRVWMCTAEACGADAGAWRSPVTEGCLHECRANPSLALAMMGEESCEAVVERARTDIGSPFERGCPGGGVQMHHAVCDVFGERFATCLDERCEAVEGDGGDLIRAYTFFCDRAINSGDFSADQLAVLITPMTTCDSPVVEMFLGDAVSEGGRLHAFCEQGPLVPAETCAAACERFVPCLTEDYDLVRDAETCVFICLATESLPAERWSCAAALDAGAACEGALACAEGGGPAPVDPVVACQPYAERITACAVERCAGLAEVAAGHALGVRDLCVEQIQSGAALATDIAAITAQTPCDDGAVAAFVDALVGEGGVDAPLCEGGPLNPIEALCRPACAVIAPCLPAEGEYAPYREPAACEFLCAQAPADPPPETWACFAAAPDCPTAFACVP